MERILVSRSARGSSRAPPRAGLTGVGVAAFSRSRVCAQLVADAAHGDDVRRRRRIVFDLLPQPADVHVDRACAAVIVITPDMLEQEVAGEHAVWGGGQRLRTVEFRSGTGDR